MSTTSTRRTVKTILYVAESNRGWRDVWKILTPVRPSPDKEKVLARLEKYRKARGAFANYVKYRVTPFAQDASGAEQVS